MGKKKPYELRTESLDAWSDVLGDCVEIADAARDCRLSGSTALMEEAAIRLAALARDAADAAVQLQSTARRARREANPKDVEFF